MMSRGRGMEILRAQRQRRWRRQERWLILPSAAAQQTGSGQTKQRNRRRLRNVANAIVDVAGRAGGDPGKAIVPLHAGFHGSSKFVDEECCGNAGVGEVGWLARFWQIGIENHPVGAESKRSA